MKKLIPLTVLLSAALVGYGLHSANESHGATQQQPAAPRQPNILSFPANAPQLAYLHIAPVAIGQLPAIEPLQGRITYDEDATSRITAPIAGRVTKIWAQLGEHVKAGQPLLNLDAPEFAQASADVRHAEADLHLKQAAFSRAKTLMDGGVLAAKDYEASSGDLQQASIELDRAHARLRNLGTAGGDGFTLCTRVSGVVTERRVNPGSEVQPTDTSNALFVVTDLAKLWVGIELPEKDLGKVQVGQHLQVESDAYPGEVFDAVASLIGSVVDPSTRRVVVRAQVDNHEGKLKPEMYVRATPLGSDIKLPHVPNDALVTEGVNSFLFVEKSPGVLEKRRITLAYRGHEESYVDSGLTAGDRVVVSGALLLNAELTGN